MATRGRKPQPKPAKGGPGPLPDPPDWLTNDDALELWHEFAAPLNRLGLLESLDRTSFGMLCDAFGAWIDMRREFEHSHHSFTISVGENGAEQQNPLQQLIGQQAKSILTLLSEFGLTPISRTKLTGSTAASPSEEVDPMEQLISRARQRAESRPSDHASTKKTPVRKKAAKKKAAKKKPVRKKAVKKKARRKAVKN